MTWINDNELDLLDKVFDPVSLIPQNRKGGLKLRHISFFYTNMKAITNVCKTLENASMHIEQAHQYTEVLRKMGLLNAEYELTKYGKMLLQIIHFDDNRIFREVSKPNITVDNIPEDIPYIIEFFLFCVVRKCLSNPEQCNKDGINVSDIDSESINNLSYFFKNIIDTLNEPSNTLDDLNDIFSVDNDENYYAIQGMNYSGYEIKRLLRLPKEEIEESLNIYLRLLDEVRSIDEETLNDRERKYYSYSSYYKDNTQKDIRNRVKHSIFNYVLYESISQQRQKIKLVKHNELEAIIPYNIIENKYYEYGLADIYNLVFFDRDSKYIINQFKKLAVSNDDISELESNMMIRIDDASLEKYIINNEDSIILITEDETEILRPNVYYVKSIEIEDEKRVLVVEPREAINMELSKKILDNMKG